MNKQAFTYCVVRYSPDQGAGEALNIGVILAAKGTGELRWRVDEHYERLSLAFAGFDGKSYKASVARLNDTLRHLQTRVVASADGPSPSVLKRLEGTFVDLGLGVKLSEARGGIGTDLDYELALLFERMVSSRRAVKSDKNLRSDEQLWRSIFAPAIPVDVAARLEPKSFSTADVEVEFPHAFKNGAWHLIQPVSLDFKTPQTIQKHATQWVGTALGLRGTPDVGTLYFLLGAPQDQGLKKTYEKARRLLAKTPLRHEIVEESDADSFAETITSIVRGAHS